MFSVYVLYSKLFNKIYIGYSSDPVARLAAHNRGSAKSYTAKFRPWIIIHTELFLTKAEAITRERQLKSARGRIFIKSLIPDQGSSA